MPPHRVGLVFDRGAGREDLAGDVFGVLGAPPGHFEVILSEHPAAHYSLQVERFQGPAARKAVTNGIVMRLSGTLTQAADIYAQIAGGSCGHATFRHPSGAAPEHGFLP